MNDTVTKAEDVLAGLRMKREALVARSTELAGQRQRISYAAHTAGGEARARLDQINRQIAMQGSEARSLDAAISEAEVRVERARQAEARAQAAKVARKLVKMADALVGLARSLDDANVIRVEASLAIRKNLNEMRTLAEGLGVSVPSDEQFTALGARGHHIN